MVFSWVFLVHVPLIFRIGPLEWQGVFEALGISGVCFLLADTDRLSLGWSEPMPGHVRARSSGDATARPDRPSRSATSASIRPTPTLQARRRADRADAQGVRRPGVPGRARRPAGHQGRVPGPPVAGRLRRRRGAEGVRPRDPPGARRRPPPADVHRDRPQARLPLHRPGDAVAAGGARRRALPTPPSSRRRRPATRRAATSTSPTRWSATGPSISSSSWAGSRTWTTSGPSRRSRASCAGWRRSRA